jgi:heat shock protein 1/8
MTSPAIGIDLGTTYSCVAVFQNGKPEIISNDMGKRTTPSCVAYNDKERLVGDAAKNQMGINTENTIFDAKRLIGRDYDDPLVQSDMKHWPFKVVESEKRCKIQVEYKGETKRMYPEEVSAAVLTKMKETAESFIGQEVKDAVITVPAYFNDAQRNSTKDAGRIAGLNVLRIINEPTAAAMAYGMEKSEGEKNILVFDLGGGTFDVSILNIDDGVFMVESTSGDTHLGGEDFDNLLVGHFSQEFKRKFKKDLTTSKRALRKLRTECEKAKRTLSSATVAHLNIESLYEGLDFNTSITRAKFEDLCGALFRDCLKPVEKALIDAKLDKSQIDEVVLVGGSTRIPKVQKLLSDFFNGKNLCQSVNPDEAVAYGAAVQAAILSGVQHESIDDKILIDVAPLSLGVAVEGAIMNTLIKRNTHIPTTQTDTFTTGMDNQPMAEICVYEGEREMVKHNNLLGKFMLELPPAPKGTLQIEITYELDNNGILKVTAVEKSSGKSSDITIKNDTNRLSEQEIKRLVEEAEKHKDEDRESVEQLKNRNAFETSLYEMKNKHSSVPEVQEYITDSLTWLSDHQDEKSTTYQQKMMELMTFVQQYETGATGDTSEKVGPSKIEEVDEIDE